MRENPFYEANSLPFHAPAFDRILDSDIAPALEEGMRQELAENERIANNPERPTFENTIEAHERAGKLLERVERIYTVLTECNTNPTLRKLKEEFAPKLAAHNDAFYLNSKFYARVKSIYDQKEFLALDAESKLLVERYYRDFVRSGAELSRANQAELRALNQEESSLVTIFQQKLLAARQDAVLFLDDKSKLTGLSDIDVEAAAEDAKSLNHKGAWAIKLENTTQQPALGSLRDRETRKRLFDASIRRAERGGDFDTRTVVMRLAQLRAQRAKLLGYNSYAAFALENQMAKTQETARQLLNALLPAAIRKAKREALVMQEIANRDRVTLEAWDWQFYSEQVRQSSYALVGAEIRPYYELERVLRDGVFFAAQQLYDVSFRERRDIPVYQPDVRVYEVFDGNGDSLALFYVDYLQRDNKRGGAWSNSFIRQSSLLNQKPVVYNVCNFKRPPPGQPVLLTHDNVVVMFHEFGHALHQIFSRVKYPYFSGTSVPRDFVEFPSQLNERWADEPVVVANYAKHYQTGAPMSSALQAKLKEVGTFGQGFATTEYVVASLLDQAWHGLASDVKISDVDEFETLALRRDNAEYSLVPSRYRTSYFDHIWGGNYAGRYYSYLWTAVLRDDAYSWFKEHGGLTRENGRRFRDLVLARGSAGDPNVIYREFCRHNPSIAALLQERGLSDSKTK